MESRTLSQSEMGELETKKMSLEGIDDVSILSDEERESVYLEMEQIFESQSNGRDLNLFDISSVPRGVKSPILFNIILITAVALSVLGTAYFLNLQGEKRLREEVDIYASVNILTQEIIQKNKSELEQQGHKLDEVQTELDNLISRRQNLADIYNRRLNNFKKQLETELLAELARLHEDLENKRFGESEILERLEVREAELKLAHTQEFDDYEQELGTERFLELQEFDERISQLQTEYDKRQAEIEQLKEEIRIREQKIQQQDESATAELPDTIRTLQELKTQKQEKEKATREFDIYHQNIIGLIKRKEFVKAKFATLEANSKISESKFGDSEESKPYLNAFDTYRTMLEATAVAQDIIDTSTGDLSNLLSSNKELTEHNQYLALQNETLLEEQEQLASIEEDYNNLKKDFARLQIEHTKSLKETNLNTDTTTQAVSDDAVDKILGNIRLISKYFVIRQLGIEDEETKEILTKLESESDLYLSIINILMEAIDPTGELEL